VFQIFLNFSKIVLKQNKFATSRILPEEPTDIFNGYLRIRAMRGARALPREQLKKFQQKNSPRIVAKAIFDAERRQ